MNNIPKIIRGEKTTGKFYHVTDPDYLKSIKKLGLVPAFNKPLGQTFQSDKKAIYSYQVFEVAFRDATAFIDDGLELLILKVNFPKGFENNFELSNEFDLVYRGIIPPHWIKTYNFKTKTFESII